MFTYLKAIRYQNLLIIALTQYLLKYLLVLPWLAAALDGWGFRTPLNHLNFFLLVLSTVLIAAAGYIINDYFDLRIDKVNKPGEVYIDTEIPRRRAILIHVVLSLIGIALGFYTGYIVGLFRLGFIHIIATAALWFYSTTFKRQLLIGNIIVSGLSALVILLVGLYEVPALLRQMEVVLMQNQMMFEENPVIAEMIAGNITSIFYFIVVFSAFAFFTSLVREIIKDMQDVEGDRIYGCQTMPVMMGINATKVIVIGLIGLIMISLAYVQKYQINDDVFSFYYFLFALQLPFGFLMYKVFKAVIPKDYKLASISAKVIMLLGIFYLFIHYRYLITPYSGAI